MIKYIKSRSAVYVAIEQRIKEAETIKNKALVRLEPILERFEVETPDEALEKVGKFLSQGNKFPSEDLQRLITDIEEFRDARSVLPNLKRIRNHILIDEAVADSLPPEAKVVVLDEDEIQMYFEPYTGPEVYRDARIGRLAGAVKAYDKGVDLGMLRRHLGEEVGVTQALY